MVVEVLARGTGQPYRAPDSAMTRAALPVFVPWQGRVTALKPFDGTPSMRSHR